MRHALIAIALFLLAACGAPTTRARPDPGLVAMGPATTDVPASGVAESEQPRFPEVVLRDPAERFRLIERLRTEVVARTGGLPETKWRGSVRPALLRQLTAAGLAPSDVEFLLWEIDEARSAAELAD
jgi:hypothetical protein